ncbi:hypothetical protein MN0502_05620 [Arthrobacter sp. MN05-02]|nr:hypothetical protein MN0502_05620 [Arthrobacter sp. MN05-02]
MEEEKGSALRAQDRPRAIAGSALAGLLALGSGLGAHLVSGGAMPSAAILCGLAALAVLVAAIAAQARLPGWAVLLLLGVTQQLLHWLLGGLAGAVDTSGGLAPGQGTHHDGNAPVGVEGAQGHSPEVMLMLHAHLAAALLVGWVVARHPRWTESVARRRRQGSDAEEGAPVT